MWASCLEEHLLSIGHQKKQARGVCAHIFETAELHFCSHPVTWQTCFLPNNTVELLLLTTIIWTLHILLPTSSLKLGLVNPNLTHYSCRAFICTEHIVQLSYQGRRGKIINLHYWRFVYRCYSARQILQPKPRIQNPIFTCHRHNHTRTTCSEILIHIHKL